MMVRVAPDCVFLDLGERYLLPPDTITTGKLLGRGGFGFVFRGRVQLPGLSSPLEVRIICWIIYWNNFSPMLIYSE